MAYKPEMDFEVVEKFEEQKSCYFCQGRENLERVAFGDKFKGYGWIVGCKNCFQLFAEAVMDKHEFEYHYGPCHWQTEGRD